MVTNGRESKKYPSEDIITIPPSHGRFFDLKANKKTILDKGTNKS